MFALRSKSRRLRLSRLAPGSASVLLSGLPIDSLIDSPVGLMICLMIAGLLLAGCPGRGGARPVTGPGSAGTPAAADESELAQDEARDLATDRITCQRGDVLACYHLGVAFADGQGRAPDLLRASALFHKACDGGVALACRHLGVMYADGRGVGKDEALAVRFFSQACDGGDPEGCSNLGGMYAMGKGVARDEKRAEELLERGCAGGDPWACERLK